MINSYVYFIKESLGELSPIKIGVAKNPEERMSALQVGNSRRLQILATIGPISEGRAYGLERELHKKFKKHHIRGEWFTGVIVQHMPKLKEDVTTYE